VKDTEKYNLMSHHSLEVMSSSKEDDMIVDTKHDHYPLCIVWTPIPLLSWLIPFIGHLGIATSEGIINDFGGPYYVNKDKHETAFGPVTKFFQVSSKQIRNLNGKGDVIEGWDSAIEQSSEDYSHMMHNLIINNCHSHVAHALNKVEFYGFTHWNTLFLILFMMFQSRFVSFPRFLKTYLGFFVIVGLVFGVSLYTRLMLR